MRRCVCPGSFDPVTLGHLDVITRAARLYDEVVVAVLENPSKGGLFDVEERIALLQTEVAVLPNVRVMTFGGGLLVDLCEQIEAQAIVKGLRGEVDYSYELPMAIMNRRLTGVETLFMPGEPGLSEVSSSLIKEVARYEGDVSSLVSPGVWSALRERLDR
ncbi:MAG: pantetheine-phosphate adenylyltransferase [Micrococcales bacterium]|nr:pantetheine-phosphate adenylyltransferase [Micrococcales bacterium]